MAETAGTSWWIKVGVLYDKSGFRNVLAGMVDINKAAGTLYSTFRKVVDVNSDMYNTAKYLNVTTDDLQRWQRVFINVGGSIEDARDAIASLNFVYDKLRLGMDTGAAEVGARLGISPEDYLSFDRMLTALNRVYNSDRFKGDFGGFRALAEQLGLNQSAMLLVTKSTQDFQRELREASKMPFIPEHQLKAARELDRLFANTRVNWELFKSSAMSATFPSLEKVFTRINEVLADPEMIKHIQTFFQELERGFNELASDENISNLIDTLGLVFKATGQAARGVTQTVSEIKAASKTEDLDLKNYLAPLYQNRFTGALLRATPVGAAYYLTQQITVDGAQNPQAVAAEITKQGKQAFSNGNANMQLVNNTSMKTSR